MRILHVAEAFGGGLLQMVVELAQGSAASGHDVAIAYGRRPETPGDVRTVVEPPVELHPMPWTSRRPGPQVAAARRLRALVRDWRPDVVHLHSSFSGAIGAAAVPREVPTIFSPNAFASSLPEGGAVRHAVLRNLERVVCRRVTLVGAVSHSEAALARSFGAAAVVRVPNGIRELDAENVVTRRDLPARAKVLATGRTVPQRQPEASGRILRGVQDIADVRWLGGGGGERGEAGRRALEGLGIPLTGWLARERVLEEMRTATAYLHWTAWDGLPFSVLEAVALDVVVVASDIPPNREILGPGGVRASEAEAVALLRSIIQDRGAALRLLEEQRARRAEFSARTMVARWHDVYEAVVAEGRSSKSVLSRAVSVRT